MGWYTFGPPSLSNFTPPPFALSHHTHHLPPTPYPPPQYTGRLNYLAAERADPSKGFDSFAAINTAIEATSLNDRAWSPCGCCCAGASLTEARLLPQDVLIRDHLGEDDVLIVSVGGGLVELWSSGLVGWRGRGAVLVVVATAGTPPDLTSPRVPIPARSESPPIHPHWPPTHPAGRDPPIASQATTWHCSRSAARSRP